MAQLLARATSVEVEFVSDASFIVLVNARGEHCVWPATNTIPAGWVQVRDAASRPDCLAYVEEHWGEIRTHPECASPRRAATFAGLFDRQAALSPDGR